MIRIRPATAADVDVLVAFTLEEARDAERASLDPARARQGVARAFEEPGLARYWVAEDGHGALVASTSIVTEWSNFHGGMYWWVQSLFVAAGSRGQGIAAALLECLAAEARAADALDLRLLVHRDNRRARGLYERAGFTPGPYVVMRRQT